jgi:hypothetical protein
MGTPTNPGNKPHPEYCWQFVKGFFLLCVLCLSIVFSVSGGGHPLVFRAVKGNSSLPTSATSLRARAPPAFFCTLPSAEYAPDFYLEKWFPTLPELFYRATGRELTPDPNNTAAACDVLLAGPFGSLEQTKSLFQQHRPHALLIFHNPENMETTAHGQPGRAAHDHCAGHADVIFSNARACLPMPSSMDVAGKVAIGGACAAIATTRPLWTPSLVHYVTPGSRCALHPLLLQPSDAHAWAARPKFALFASSHHDYPRDFIFDKFSVLGAHLDARLCPSGGDTRCGRRIDAPGLMNHNMELPGNDPTRRNPHEQGHFPNSSLQRAALNYRYALQPENSLSWTRGWMTEKVGNAHLAGQVPVYWGDPLLEEFWNPKRVLVLGDNPFISDPRAPNFTAIWETVDKLETDRVFREAFFSEPVLAPSAAQWMANWCSDAEQLLQKGYERFRK